MEIVEKAIETTAIIDAHQQLVLDKPLPIVGPTKVRVIILLPEDVAIDENQWLTAVSLNPDFDFLKDAEEDIYTLGDGRPFNDKGESGFSAFPF